MGGQRAVFWKERGEREGGGLLHCWVCLNKKARRSLLLDRLRLFEFNIGSHIPLTPQNIRGGGAGETPSAKPHRRNPTKQSHLQPTPQPIRPHRPSISPPPHHPWPTYPSTPAANNPETQPAPILPPTSHSRPTPPPPTPSKYRRGGLTHPQKRASNQNSTRSPSCRRERS